VGREKAACLCYSLEAAHPPLPGVATLASLRGGDFRQAKRGLGCGVPWSRCLNQGACWEGLR